MVFKISVRVAIEVTTPSKSLSTKLSTFHPEFEKVIEKSWKLSEEG